MSPAKKAQITINDIGALCDELVGSTLDISQDIRSGDDGAYGRHLEKELNVPENNRSEADILLKDGHIELKTTNGKSNMTLFSKEPTWIKPYFARSRDFFEAFSKCGHRLNTAIKSSPNNLSLHLQIKEDSLFIMHEDKPCAYWELDPLLDHAAKKLDTVWSFNHTDGTINKVEKYSDMSRDNFIRLVESGELVVEIRISKGGKKNRGTAFRISPKKITKLYENNTGAK